VAAGAVLVFLGWTRPSGFSWRKWIAALALVVASFGAMGVTGGRLNDLAAGRETMAWSRYDLWSGALRVVRSAPLAGVGLGAFGEAWPGVRPERYAAMGSAYAHNEPLQAAAETGLVGLGLFAWLATALFRSRRSARSEPRIAGVMVVLAVFSLTDFALHVPVLAALAVAGLRGMDRFTRAPNQAPPSSGRRWAMAAAVAGWVLFLALDSASGMRCRKAARQAERGDEAGALASLRSALALMPLNATAAAGIGELDRDAPDAAGLVKRAMRLRPAWTVPLSQAMSRASGAGDRASAEGMLDRARAVDPWGLETRLMEARLAVSRREFGRAGDVLESAGKVWPANIDLWFERARLAEASGQGGKARSILREILRIQPGSAYARRWMERLSK
jgi:hypothetical protein